MSVAAEHNDDMREEREKPVVEIRATEPEDFPQLSEVLRRAWMVAYPHEPSGITPAFLERHTASFLQPEGAQKQRD